MTSKKKNEAEILGKADEFTEIHENSFVSQIPLFNDSISAGFPSPAEDYIDKKLDLNELLVKKPAATFFVRVEGDSMIGAGINPDDILVVDRSLEPANNKIVIAVIDGELTVKRIILNQKKCYLKAENPKYKPIPLNPDSDFRIWGVVTYVIHKAE